MKNSGAILVWLAGLIFCTSGFTEVKSRGESYSHIKFTRMTEQSGITFKHERATFAPQLENIMPWLTAGGAGVAIADYNNDGLDDIYFTTSKMGGKNHLYRNAGEFKFVEVAEAVGLANLNSDIEIGTSSFALWLDYNNDGWQDLFLLRFGMTSLFENVAGKRFKETTEAAGLRRRTNALSAIAFDYDNDGDVDIYIGGYFPETDFFSPKSGSKVLFDSWETARNAGPNYLFRNNGNGTFSDVTGEAGVEDSGWAMAVGHSDINNDGWQDIYIANDFGTDILFRNMGGGRFNNISKSAIGVDTKKGMNAEFGDYNNDGLIDIYVTNMTEPYLHECNMLWRNQGNDRFTDVSQETNSCDTRWGWGAKFIDVNNDGLLDIYAANGFISAGEDDYMDILLDFIFRDDIDLRDAKEWPKMSGFSMAGYERNVLFMQDSVGFVDIASDAGVDSVRDSRGVAISDFDNDGRMDIVVSNVAAPPELYRNVSTNSGNWIAFNLKSHNTSVNQYAIGARVEVSVSGVTQTREIMSASGFDAQSTLKVHFGIGVAKEVESVRIVWPDGTQQKINQLKANTLYEMVLPKKG